MQDFMTPPKHVNFHVKKLFGEMGRIVDGSVAYIELNGGGQTELHTHEWQGFTLHVNYSSTYILGLSTSC